jgi:cobalt-zinc-cadmium efflux system membrane fusion protein
MTRNVSELRSRLANPMVQRGIFAVLAIALVAGGTGLWRTGHSKQAAPVEKQQKQPNRVSLPEQGGQLAFLKLETATTAQLPASEPMNARLTLAEDLTARIFPPLAGRMVSLQASIGDTVKMGAPLAILDAPDFGQAIADLSKAEADSNQKRKALIRAEVLFQGDALARRELEMAEADAHAANAEAQRARLRLANLAPSGSRIEGQRLVLRAPLAGVIIDRQANPGTEVRPDATNPLFVISDLRRLWLNIDLPEKAAALAKAGETVNFTLDAYPGIDFSGRVDRVGAAVDPATRRIPVRAVVDNADGRLKPEMFARATLSAPGAAQVIRLPTSAILTGGLTVRVFVQVGPRDFEQRTVTIARQDAESTYLAPDSAVKPGEIVVVRGAILLASEMAQGE